MTARVHVSARTGKIAGHDRSPEDVPTVVKRKREVSIRALVLGVLALTAVAGAIAVTASLVRGVGPGGDRAELPFPPYWAQLEEGRTTKAEVRGLAGAPDEVASNDPGEECWYYELLAPSQNYRFCFRGETLSFKAHY